jgi:alkyldihydroxyacetonephosphate synthase
MSDLLDRLRAIAGAGVRSDDVSRAERSRDWWMLSDLRDFEGRSGPLPLAVVEPATTQEVAEVVRVCRAAKTPIVPYGGGSGVCGGVLPSADAIVLSTARLAGLVALDDANLTATFRAGSNGLEAEERVQQAGLTIGHWPQSIALSTVGGWVATRAAGQFSTAYGNIEDVVQSLEAVLPDGSVLRTRDTPRAAAGPDLRQLLLGSEGTLGVVTEVTFSLRPLPEASRGQAFHFADLHAGLEPIRRLMRVGWRPPVVRLYDARESERHFPEQCPSGRAMLILLHEGPAALVEVQQQAVATIARACDGVETDAAAVDLWLDKRNHVPTFREFLEKGIVLDTIEVAATWDKVGPLYDRVTESLREVPGLLVASSHSSHSYRSGTNLYFTFVARPAEADALERTYLECWKRTLDAAIEIGAGIAHHHGIGRVRRDALPDEIGATGVSLLRAVKRTLDPDDLFNPGALIPPESRGA